MITFLGSFLGVILGFLVSKLNQKEKIYISQYPNWLKVSENPIPENIDKRLVVTQDKKVHCDRFEVTYNSKGQPTYSGILITHWMPYPDLPKE